MRLFRTRNKSRLARWHVPCDVLASPALGSDDHHPPPTNYGKEKHTCCGCWIGKQPIDLVGLENPRLAVRQFSIAEHHGWNSHGKQFLQSKSSHTNARKQTLLVRTIRLP